MEDNPTPKAELVGRAKGYANLKPNPHKLKKGTKGRQKPLSKQDIDWAAHYAKTGSIVGAAVYAGFRHPHSAYNMLDRKNVREMVKHYHKQFVEEAKENVERDFELGRSIVDASLAQIIMHGRSTRDRLTGIELALKSMGLIQPNGGAVAISGAAAAATVKADIKATRLFLPDWRREAIEEVQNGEQCTSTGEVQTSK